MISQAEMESILKGRYGEYLTVGEASLELGLSRPTVVKRCKAGEIKGVETVGNVIRIPAKSLVDYFARESPKGLEKQQKIATDPSLMYFSCAMALLRKSRYQAQQLVMAGELSVVQRGKRFLITRKSVDSFLSNQKNKAVKP